MIEGIFNTLYDEIIRAVTWLIVVIGALVIGIIFTVMVIGSLTGEIDSGNELRDQQQERIDSLNAVIDSLETDAKSLALEVERTVPENIWLARALYSETKRVEEMSSLAWVIRNRVETGYRGDSTYRDVILSHRQFSAFNKEAPRRWWYRTRSVTDPDSVWQKALDVAREVRLSPEITFRATHYYSHRSMKCKCAPAWADPNLEIAVADIESNRFRFYNLD